MVEPVHILYMEDNEGTARLLEKRLTRAGYRIDTVPNGEAGLKRCTTRSYDVIIVDYNMPGLSGIDVIERLVAQGIQSPTIVLTGTGNERIAVEALKLGAFDYMVKDIDGVYFDLLPTTIEQALKNQQLLEEKRHAEEALRESEERFRMLFERAPNPYFVNDMSGNLIDCNQAVELLLGLSIDELIGKHFTEIPLFNQDQFQEVAEILSTMSAGAFAETVELDITRSDGQKIVVDLRMIPIQTKGQTQILGIGHDITWRKRAEAQMKAHIERLETLSRIDDELTRQLDIQYVQNMAFENMMVLSGAKAGSIALMDDAQVLSVRSVGYPEELNQHYTPDSRSIVARVARQREAEWIRDVTEDSDYLAVSNDTCSQITIPLVSRERLVGIVNLETNRPDCFTDELFEFLKLIATRVAVAIDNARLYDVSQRQLVELKNLYKQVSELEQLKTDMIRLAAHDLCNPLAIILTKTYLLRATLVDHLGQKQQNYIDSINSAVERMQTLITDFLSVERIEETILDESVGQSVDLMALVQRVCESHHAQAEEKALVLHVSSPDTSFMVRGFEIELQQVIANLISNAIKYTPEGGTIDVRLQREDTLVQFEVTDSGYGIPVTQQQKLFQPFFRVQTDETKSIEGTGLGLYLVKKFIERNRGEILFHSEYGKGSTFGFTLPLV